MLQLRTKLIFDPLSDDSMIACIDPDTKNKYRRVVGGIAWPGIEPGFAVVVGEDADRDDEMDTCHYRVLAEKEEQDIDQLLAWCEMLEINSRVGWTWYGNPKNKPAMAFVWPRRDKLEKVGRRILSIASAPYVDNPKGFEFSLNLLRRRLKADHKTLHLGDESKLPTYLTALASTDLKDANAEDHPAVAAIGYAVAALETWRDSGMLRIHG